MLELPALAPPTSALALALEAPIETPSPRPSPPAAPKALGVPPAIVRLEPTAPVPAPPTLTGSGRSATAPNELPGVAPQGEDAEIVVPLKIVFDESPREVPTPLAPLLMPPPLLLGSLLPPTLVPNPEKTPPEKSEDMLEGC